MGIFWRRFHKDCIPEYLARNYWWAYVWDFGIWFWDHQPIVNMILFGQYRNLINATLERFKAFMPKKTLQISGVYGSITPELAEVLHEGEFQLVDITPGQLHSAKRKLKETPNAKRFAQNLARMNAEKLAYADNSFDAVLIFFLLHELPPEVRRQVLTEALRVVEPGGRLVLTEYGERTKTHFFHWFPIARWILGFFEPFVPEFIGEDFGKVLSECAEKIGKKVSYQGGTVIFKGFYRNVEYLVE